MHEAAVGVEEGGEAADEDGADGVRAEGEGTYDRDFVHAAGVYARVAAAAAVDAIFAFLVADVAVGFVFARAPH